MNCEPGFLRNAPRIAAVNLDFNGFGLRLGDLRKPRPTESQPRQPRRRVPDCDIVYVGVQPVRLEEPVDVRDLAPARRQIRLAAAPQAISASKRSLMRPLLALLVLEVAFFGALHIRKRIIESQVIVVPATTNARSVIT